MTSLDRRQTDILAMALGLLDDNVEITTKRKGSFGSHLTIKFDIRSLLDAEELPKRLKMAAKEIEERL